jgi:hypothetical protein
MLFRVHLAWAGIELNILVVIGTDYIDSYKSNYHTFNSFYSNQRWVAVLFNTTFEYKIIKTN